MDIQVREALRREFAQSPAPTPIGVAGLIEDLAQATEFLLSRGWEIDDIDAEGIGLLWPSSWVDEAHHSDAMVTPITIMTLRSNRTAGYVLAGLDALVRGGSGTLDLRDVSYNSRTLVTIEDHRFITTT